MLEDVKLWLKVWLNPVFWNFNGLYSAKHEKLYKMILENRDRLQFVRKSICTVTVRLDDYLFVIWTSNYPYSYLQEIEVLKIDRDKPFNEKRLWECTTSILKLGVGHPGRLVVYQMHQMLQQRFQIDVEGKKLTHFQQNEIVNQVVNELNKKRKEDERKV